MIIRRPHKWDRAQAAQRPFSTSRISQLFAGAPAGDVNFAFALVADADFTMALEVDRPLTVALVADADFTAAIDGGRYI